MRNFLLLIVVFGMCGCEWYSDITEVSGSCTIIMADGTSVQTQDTIRIMESTNIITYRDADGKLWSVAPEDYKSYSCSN